MNMIGFEVKKGDYITYNKIDSKYYQLNGIVDGINDDHILVTLIDDNRNKEIKINIKNIFVDLFIINKR